MIVSEQVKIRNNAIHRYIAKEYNLKLNKDGTITKTIANYKKNKVEIDNKINDMIKKVEER